MKVDALVPWPMKRRRLMSFDPMEADIAQAKLADMVQKLGREIRVSEALATSLTADPYSEEPEDFYELTTDDYYRILATRKEDKFLKTRKIREAEEAACRSRITKAVIRVRFPDDYTLEAKFHSSETFQSLVDLLMKVIARPDLPFYIYTTPPKKQIIDMSQDFYSAGFAPGAIVYFSYNVPKDDSVAVNSWPFLRDEIMCLKGLDLIPEQAESIQSAPEPVVVGPSPVVQYQKPVEKKPVKPKWLKM
ncbi:hypothetical protein HHK36_007525 [Tetracentron sinense]|uniref:UBX domain-containing protein n=1 Tax=Tetracentron sinense TaxID=13715 RepID=A0A835DLV5_TETSI|nr:hypothetical protein HHK36_007525 [Tetracentron sinense]